MSETSPVKRPRMEDHNQNGDTIDDHKVKICNDSVHGHIEIPEVCLAILDTPQFQRLRFIKQLGFCYYVYPGASHNRFEHSIGVCHLAGELVRSLKSRQPDLGITKKDILCVELAGLCHDLGHGPHSHMFDGKFIPQVLGNRDWKHEKASLDMLDYLLEDNGFTKLGYLVKDSILVKHGLDDNDILFIKELIYGPLEGNGKSYKGRGEDKIFLYEIISNKKTGIDVDKWDYFARDCHHLGVVNNFDHKRFIKFARVLKVDGHYQICERDKEIGNLYQMFYTRYVLHRVAYQHKVNCACEIMAVDALIKANDFLKILGKDGKEYKMSECIHHMPAYAQVTDNILWQIYTSQDPNLEKSKKILKRLFSRDLYRCIDERILSTKLQKELTKDEMQTMQNLRQEMIDYSQNFGFDSLQGADFRLQFIHMDFGNRDEDPLKAMMYYSKSDPNLPNRGRESGLMKPPRFIHSLIRLYCLKHTEDICNILKRSFDKLCEKWNIGSAEQTSQGWESGICRTPERMGTSPLSSDVSASRGRASMSQD